MKMPSTYISLLLLCGLILLFYYTHKGSASIAKPGQVRPMVKDGGPLVKKYLPEEGTDVYLNKNQGDGDKQEQTGLNESGFSLFKDVISGVAPALKNFN
ncbi:hypothetical protein [Mucilaginibacter sp.]|jgi:hypothetical protein|uniref:hypothetical protein n=1 Tax=Mucilaginibacter sp. TaxID=1882438 RepID=UPI002BB7FE0E|nr:hypothetical protein [Mucilaginibacter sp.]HTI60370.1 hypothetical protein [Mucilaginibacter sp.]